MKKLFSLFLTSCLVMSMLSACSSSSSSSSGSSSTSSTAKTTELTLWMPPLSNNSDDAEMWAGILAPFEAENNAKVSVEIIPWSNYEEKYLTGITSGFGPDVGYMYMEMISDFISMEAVEPLDSYMTAEDKENYLYLENGFINGAQYCMPFVVGNAAIMVYNKDILEANGITGIPATWEDFIAACQKIKTDTDGDGTADIYRYIDRWGNTAISGMNTAFYPYLWQAGGSLFSEDGTEFTLDSEAGREAVQFLYDLRFTYDILPEETTSLAKADCLELFNSGKAAFCVMEAKNAASLDNTDINWDYITSLTKETMGTFIASDSLVLMSASENKDLSMKLIRYMTNGDAMATFHESAPFPPIAKDEEYHDNTKFETIYEQQREYLHSLAAVKGSYTIYEALYKNLQLMMIGEMTPDQVVSETTSYAQTVLAE